MEKIIKNNEKKNWKLIDLRANTCQNGTLNTHSYQKYKNFAYFSFIFALFGMSEGRIEWNLQHSYNNNNKNAKKKNVNFIIHLNEKQTFKGMIRKLVTNDKRTTNNTIFFLFL